MTGICSIGIRSSLSDPLGESKDDQDITMAKKTELRKLKIGVLMGGKSVENEVSFNSGRTICDHLDNEKYEVIPIFQTLKGQLFILPLKFLHRGKTSDFLHRLEKEAEKICWDDLKKLVDFVYIATHGRFAEDGTLQAMLEILGIPYLGSKVFASALARDKFIAFDFMKLNGIDIPKHFIVNPEDQNNKNKISENLEKEKIDFPCIVKPHKEGSSLGIKIAKNIDDLLKAVKDASETHPEIIQPVLIEEKLDGLEFTCIPITINGDLVALPPTEIVVENKTDIFDYEQKYMPGRATKYTPARLPKEIIKRIQETCIKVMHALEITNISRIDGFYTKDGRIVIIDPNTLSGMAPSSFLFRQAAEIYMSHTKLINHLIETELKNYNIKIRSKNNMKTKNKLRVAVLFGGRSNEREISLESGRNIFYKLSPEKYVAIPIFVDKDLNLFKINQKLLVQNNTAEIEENLDKSMQIKWSELPEISDFVFIGLHGGEGEDGTIQGALEMLEIPYNGSSIFTSALCMDKYKTNQFLKTKGFNIPESVFIKKEEWNVKKEAQYIQKLKANRSNGSTQPSLKLRRAGWAFSPELSRRVTTIGGSDPFVLSEVEGYEHSQNRSILEKISTSLNAPWIVKPHNDGCSVLVKKAKNIKELETCINEILEKKDSALVEECISGMELTVGIIGNEDPIALPPSQAISQADILSIQEKFLPGQGENQTPAPIKAQDLKLVQKTAADIYKAVGCMGYARIDCFFDEKTKKITIIEINTLPGMTPATCIFHQAAEIGLSPMQFVDKIVELGLENWSKYRVKNIDRTEKKSL